MLDAVVRSFPCLRLEEHADREAVRQLHLAAFGDHGVVVAALVDDLRAEHDGLALVADDDGEVVRAVRSPPACSIPRGGWSGSAR
jgi:predicted N-acetyltransferase YhbS